ncbi:MAG TPA: entericidin A/B family lipoprotein [Acidisoma sp.]|uniref:entericidin A/B family lipoprotein n=1 Tax=Acidisoma sp. TaxID=1872115 RepID=UPI002C2F8A59|nr:entericidin A/B family lipoprotein [Acidisoma sp.]HTI02601.1 entericidin A/B family lipoprotein [Acidisoma sp.]
MTKVMRLDGTFLRTAMIGLLLAGAAISLSACNTVAGAGQDVKNTGQATTNAADNVQQKM